MNTNIMKKHVGEVIVENLLCLQSIFSCKKLLTVRKGTIIEVEMPSF